MQLDRCCGHCWTYLAIHNREYVYIGGIRLLHEVGGLTPFQTRRQLQWRELATKLVDEFFDRFSVPEQLHSDRGRRQFESGVMLMYVVCSRYIKVAQHHTTLSRTALLSDLTGH